MRSHTKNPFLPKAPLIRWRKGPFARKPLPGTPESAEGAVTVPNTACAPSAPARAHPNAGKLSFDTGASFNESNAGWGSNLDMFPLGHGPSGCGAFAQTTRLNMPGFIQGIESFTALDASTSLDDADFKDAGDTKLGRAIDEAQELFPLARGMIVVREDPLAILPTNIKAVAAAKAEVSQQLIVSIPGDSIAATLHKAAKQHTPAPANRYDVAIPFERSATGLVWIVAKMLREIGLNPILELTGSSAGDMARIGQCKAALSFYDDLDFASDQHRGNPRDLWKWYGMPLVPVCFFGPSATEASLRAIASRFDAAIQARAETVIAANREKIDAIVAHYRPRLEGKLVLLLHGIPKTHREIFHLLGMRIGTCKGWLGSRGVQRFPRLAIEPYNTTEKALASYIAEAKPDLIYHMNYDEHDWHKRGLPSLPFASPFFDHGLNLCWGYDGFACFTALLDRHLNAPWRKLAKPPWADQSG